MEIHGEGQDQDRHHEAHEVHEGELWSWGLAAAFGGTTSEQDKERESPVIKGLSRCLSCSLVVSPA
jgi:hypothetical protein